MGASLTQQRRVKEEGLSLIHIWHSWPYTVQLAARVPTAPPLMRRMHRALSSTVMGAPSGPFISRTTCCSALSSSVRQAAASFVPSSNRDRDWLSWASVSYTHLDVYKRQP